MHFGPGESSEDVVMMSTPVVKAALEMGFSRSLVRQTVQRQILATGENYRTVSDLMIGLLDAEDEMREEQMEQAAEEEKESDDLALIQKNKMVLFQHLMCVTPILDCLLSARTITEQEYNAVKQKPRTLQARTLIDTVLAKGNTAATSFRNSLQEIYPVLYRDIFVQQDIRSLPTGDIAALPMEEQLQKLQEERMCKVCMDREVSIVFILCGHLVVCKNCAPSEEVSHLQRNHQGHSAHISLLNRTDGPRLRPQPGAAEVQCHSQLHKELEASLDHTRRHQTNIKMKNMGKKKNLCLNSRMNGLLI